MLFLHDLLTTTKKNTFLKLDNRFEDSSNNNNKGAN